MKFRAEYMIPIVILFVVVIISLCDSCIYFMPYDPEGFDNVHIPLGSTIFEPSEKQIQVKIMLPVLLFKQLIVTENKVTMTKNQLIAVNNQLTAAKKVLQI